MVKDWPRTASKNDYGSNRTVGNITETHTNDPCAIAVVVELICGRRSGG